MPGLRRVGHKGADLIAPGNTLASFDAALEAGVDMIEFDVLPERGTKRLILAHDYTAVGGPNVPTLEEGLAHFCTDAYAGVELDVDLKGPGYEEEVVTRLREHGLVDRALVSSQYVESLARVREIEPKLRLGWSVPKAQRDYTESLLLRPLVIVILALYRATLPRRAARALRAGRCDAIMAHWRLASAKLAHAVRDAGGELFVWTVDDAAQIRELEGLGVSGVITNDPRLFTAAA